jgi:hypothetical protein
MFDKVNKNLHSAHTVLRDLVCVSKSDNQSLRLVASLLLVFIIIFNVFPREAHSEEATRSDVLIEGLAYAADQASAENAALNELQHNLQDLIRNHPSYCNSVATAVVPLCETDKSQIVTHDKLPLLGLEYQLTSKESALAGAKASISSQRSLAAYRTVLNNEKDIITNWGKDNPKVRGFKRAVVSDKDISIQLSRFYQLAIVAALLGDDSYLNTSFAIAQNQSSPKNVKKFDTVEAAAEHVAGLVSGENVFVSPPRPANAIEITPFGAAFLTALKNKVGPLAAVTPANNDSLSGVYKKDKQDLLMQYQLYSKDFLLKDRVTLRISNSAYKEHRIQPQAPAFDQVLILNETAQQGFRSQISTQMGDIDLLFQEGDTVRLFVQLSQPGYFYIVGHVVKPDGQFSYLLELNDEDNEGKFVGYVPPDQVNRAVDLGEFTVEAPFGVEYLQLIAANKDLKPRLPEYSWDRELEYFVINGSKGDAKEAVKKVRGLKKKSRKITYHESQLAYTTQPK